MLDSMCHVWSMVRVKKNATNVSQQYLITWRHVRRFSPTKSVYTLHGTLIGVPSFKAPQYFAVKIWRVRRAPCKVPQSLDCSTFCLIAAPFAVKIRCVRRIAVRLARIPVLPAQTVKVWCDFLLKSGTQISQIVAFFLTCTAP